MRNIHRGNRKEQRVIPPNATPLSFPEYNIDFYISSTARFPYTLLCFIGNTKNKKYYYGFRDMKTLENQIKKTLDTEKSKIEMKQIRKIQVKERNANFKKSIIPGVILRTVFSYNMTFNKFYKVISKNGNKVTVQSLGNKWVSGEPGWTGEVSPDLDNLGGIVEAKFTSRGLKLDRGYADIINPTDTFYENHLD